MNSVKYVEFLETALIPYPKSAKSLMGEDSILQQDKTHINASRVTKAWLEDKYIPL